MGVTKRQPESGYYDRWNGRKFTIPWIDTRVCFKKRPVPAGEDGRGTNRLEAESVAVIKQIVGQGYGLPKRNPRLLHEGQEWITGQQLTVDVE